MYNMTSSSLLIQALTTQTCVHRNMSKSNNGFANLTSTDIIVFDVIECLIGAMGSMTNMMVLLAIYKERSLRTITNCFVGSLAASDVLVGVVVPPLVVISSWRLKINFTACVLINSSVVLLTNISVLNLLSVAIDRFAAIRKPFIYHRWMSMHRALYLVAATWLAACFIGLLPVLGWNNGQDEYTKCSFRAVISLDYLVFFIFFIVTLPPMIAMISIYCYIFRVVRKARQKQNQLLTTVIQKDELKYTFKKNTRGDRGILMVILLFIVCWMPLHITNILLRFSHLSIPSEVYQLFNVLSRLNSFINPFLFAFGYSKFKITIKKLLFKRCLNVEKDNAATKSRFRKCSRRAKPHKPTLSFSSASLEATSNIHAVLHTMHDNSPPLSIQQAQLDQKQLQRNPSGKLSATSHMAQGSMYDILRMMSEDLIFESSFINDITASTVADEDGLRKTYSLFSNEFISQSQSQSFIFRRTQESMGSLHEHQEPATSDSMKSTFV